MSSYYIIVTEECHSVREFLDLAFNYIGFDSHEYLEQDELLYPSEVFYRAILLKLNKNRVEKTKLGLNL